jgi:hypothetical protein
MICNLSSLLTTDDPPSPKFSLNPPISSTFNTCIIFLLFFGCISTCTKRHLIEFFKKKTDKNNHHKKRSFNCKQKIIVNCQFGPLHSKKPILIQPNSAISGRTHIPFSFDIMTKIPSPLNLAKWLSENEDKLKPPIGNYMLQVGNGTQVMAVGGPNARTDFHINETEVFNFYRL